MSDVFISYSRKDATFARQLIDKLTLTRKDSWVDWEGIPLASPNWWDEIKAGIEYADNFVFIMSPASMASVICNIELDYAFELGKRIVPIIYKDVRINEVFASIADFTPDNTMQERLNGRAPLIIARDNWQKLSHMSWVSFRESDNFDEAFDRLIHTVETDLNYVKEHTRYLIRATEWERANRQPDLLLFGSTINIAEEWLSEATTLQKMPSPTDLQVSYIKASRIAEDKRQRQLRRNPLGAITSLFGRGSNAEKSYIELSNQVKTMRLMMVYQLMQDD